MQPFREMLSIAAGNTIRTPVLSDANRAAPSFAGQRVFQVKCRVLRLVMSLSSPTSVQNLRILRVPNERQDCCKLV